MDIVSEEVNENMTKSKALEVEAKPEPEPEPELEPDPDAVTTQATDEETTLQQLKAKKNKSNLFLIKSYSFIERANNNNNNDNNGNTNNNGIGRAGSKVSSASVPSADLLQSPDLQPFDNIESIFLAQATDKDDKDKGWSKKRAVRLKKPKKEKPPKQPKIKSKTNAKDKAGGKAKGDLAEPEEKLLRRKQPVFLPLPLPLTSSSRLHEYEEILETTATNGHGSLPRPQSLPAKVHFENAAATITTTSTTATVSKETGTVKRSSANIKRESFLRQSLQSIRRSFGSNKHSPKLAMALESPESPTAESVICSRSSSSSAASTSSAVSCSSSSASSWSSTSAAINILSKASGHNRRLDEIMPTPVVLLLNDDLMLQLQLDEIDGDGGDTLKRSTSSVSAIATGNAGIEELSSSVNGLASSHNGAASASETAPLNEKQQQQQNQKQRQQQYSQQHSLQETTDPATKKDRSLRHSYSSSLSPLNQLETSGSVRSLGSSPSPSPSPRSSHSQSSGSAAGTGCNYTGNTAKQHEQQSAVAAAVPPGLAQSTSAAAAAAAAAASASGNVSTTSNGATAVGSASTEKDKDKDKEKEKKRKEVSSSRVKKFHRHFTQISKDEKLINYFSCALVSDILLQGHLYITDQHFAFYSNVFGYVTKVVIPTTSVTKISKEKMAKIIPNAVGVATMDERHVFGSFISRESAFRLMCTVCPQLAAGAEILPKPLPVDSEMPEEFFNEDDSSCSISGNESPPQVALDKGSDKLQPIVEPPLLRQRIVGNAEPKPPRHSDMPGKKLHSLDVNGPGSVIIRSSAPPIVHYEEQKQQLHSSRLSSASTSTANSANVSASSTGPPSSSSSPITVVGVGAPLSPSAASLPSGPMGGAVTSSRFLGGRFGGLIQAARSRFPVPSLTELHVLYLGIMLSIMLALFSAFLLYRILDIEAKTSLYHTPIDFNWHNAGNDEDIFAEALRWQKELQAKSTAEAQHILSKNLEQITKVRRSLETLSMLIHDRRSGYGEQQAAGQSQQDLDLDQVVTASGQSHSDNSD